MISYPSASKDIRFEFGENWARFLRLLDDDRILEAEKSLKEMLDVDDLVGKRFLDIGCGSGLFSLAAKRLGAKVYSFDFDTQSVSCTQELKRRYYPNDQDWTIEKGSVLDQGYIKSLNKFDIVYSWGVLHHTGMIWQALDNAQLPVGDAGKLFISIYNDQGLVSRYWYFVKKIFNKNIFYRLLIILFHLPYLLALRILVRLARGRLALERGMSYWYDMMDWLGGYPFEVAKPEEIFDFYRRRGFTLMKLKTQGSRHGCNEFVFKKNSNLV